MVFGRSREQGGGAQWARIAMRASLVTAAGAVLLAGAEAEGDFIGCYADNARVGDLSPPTKMVMEKLDLPSCIRHCTSTNGGPFKFLGLLNGDTCVCGDSYGRWGRSEECTMRCVGDDVVQPRGGCGGARAVSVYDVGTSKEAVHSRVFKSLTSQNTFVAGAVAQQETVRADRASGQDPQGQGVTYTTEALGCFQDKSPGRAFEDGPHDDEELTIESCAKMCTSDADKETRFIAVQDGNQCFCGKEDGAKYGPSTKCNKKCVGDPTKSCGGAFANEVFRLVPHYPGKADSAEDAGAPFFLNCGIPGAVQVVFIVVTATSIPSHGFFASMVVASLHNRAPQSIFAGALLGQAFLLTITGLAGHIIPDSTLVSLHNARLIAVVFAVVLGLVQVAKSFAVAAKDQEDRCEEFRMVMVDLARPSGARDPESGAKAAKEEEGEGFSAAYVGFTSSLCADWGGHAQLGIFGLSCMIDLTSVFYGGLLAKLFSTSIAVVCTHTTLIGRNSTALKLHFVSGLCYFLLGMHTLLELSDG